MSLDSLGALHWAQGQYAKAEPLYARILVKADQLTGLCLEPQGLSGLVPLAVRTPLEKRAGFNSRPSLSGEFRRFRKLSWRDQRPVSTH